MVDATKTAPSFLIYTLTLLVCRDLEGQEGQDHYFASNRDSGGLHMRHKQPAKLAIPSRVSAVSLQPKLARPVA